jgi:hypothetical protein
VATKGRERKDVKTPPAGPSPGKKFRKGLKMVDVEKSHMWENHGKHANTVINYQMGNLIL